MPPPPPPGYQPAPPELNGDVLGDILQRIPPEDLVGLFNAALVSKSWLRMLASTTFRRSYREHHRTPPLLGFIANLYDEGTEETVPRFVSTTASPCSSPAVGCHALDSRHGRVLLHRFEPSDLVVWNPITGDHHQLPMPAYSHVYYTGAVICATPSCEHLDCSGGPFLVVFVGTDDDEEMTWATVYSSETCGWSTMVTVDRSANIDRKPGVLIGDALYFTVAETRTLELGKAVLKYDLAEQSLTVVDAPEMDRETGIVMVAEDGGLGFASIEGDDLHLWSWTGDGNTAGWNLCRVIQLQSLLPDCNSSSPYKLIGFAEGANIIFLETPEEAPEAGVFTIDLMSENVRKVDNRGGYYAVVPYMSFCGPAHWVN